MNCARMVMVKWGLWAVEVDCDETDVRPMGRDVLQVDPPSTKGGNCLGTFFKLDEWSQVVALAVCLGHRHPQATHSQGPENWRGPGEKFGWSHTG